MAAKTPKKSLAAAVPGFNGQLDTGDPSDDADLIVRIRCANEAAAYNILLEIASKMRLQCWKGLDDVPEGRSLPEMGTTVELATRGDNPLQVGSAVVVPHENYVEDHAN